MTRGELHSERLLAVLSRIAREHASGSLQLTRTGLVSEEGQVFVHSGQVYAASAGRERFPIGARLVTAFGLAPEALDEALRAQATVLKGWRVGEILVHLGHVQPGTVEEASREQLLDALTDMSGWESGTWTFTADERTRTMVSAALPYPEVEALVTARQAEWQALLPVVRGAHAVPLPIAVGMDGSMFDPVTAALLTRIDGVRTLAEVAHDRGLSVLETGRAIAGLSAVGAVRIGESLDGGSAIAMLEALAALPYTDPQPEPVAPVVDLDAARQARAADRAADTAARETAQREAADQELAEAARRSAEAQTERAAEAARIAADQEARAQALQAEREEMLRTERELQLEAERRDAAAREQELAHQEAELQARAEAEVRRIAAEARAAALAEAERRATDTEAQEQRRRQLEAERQAQAEAEAESESLELSLAAELRSVSGPSANTADLAAALSAALATPSPMIPVQPDHHDEALEVMAVHPLDELPEPAYEVPTVPQPVVQSHVLGAPTSRGGDADMASLFRELSSLGLDEDAGSSAPRPSHRPPPGATDPKKKKKGLFGR